MRTDRLLNGNETQRLTIFYLACGFRNCEFRSYEMIKDGEEVKLEETERSKALRNAPPLPPHQVASQEEISK